MQEKRDLSREEKDERTESTTEKNEPPETAEHPLPGIKHKHEPDAENIMPAENRPGTL